MDQFTKKEKGAASIADTHSLQSPRLYDSTMDKL